ncbi:MAG: hypothetical protein VYA54_07525 [Bdellovibrionota bacterium]|nr:hypothetical protein [Bdellovibrionota bacterium]
MRVILLVLFLVSCQSHYSSHMPQTRGVASGEVFSKFVRTLSQQAKMSSDDIERSILTYIKQKGTNNTHHNYQLMGITEEQAGQIKSLNDNLPFMPKVRKWAMENMDKINPRISKGTISDVYQSIVVEKKGIINPYAISSDASRTARQSRRQTLSPIQSISEKDQRILDAIRKINNRSVEDVYRKNLASMQSRGAQNPAIHANGQEIVESAALITQKTGLKAMGEGCEQFSKTASMETLEIKANIDLYRAQLVEERAVQKAGRQFASVDEIPEASRLTAQELDDITVQSFRDVVGYTDDEARAALARLKKKPCKLY